MSQIITDLSVQKEWIARRGFNNQFSIAFLEDGDPFDISDYTFSLNIRKIGDTANKLQLDQVEGLTNGGSSGMLTVQLSVEDSNLLRAQSYYYELNYSISGNPYGLLHGTLKIVQQYNDDQVSDSITIPVNLGGSEISMEVNLVGPVGLSVSTTTTTATLTPSPSYDAFEFTALASALDIANPSTAYGNFDPFIIRIKDDGTARALTFGNKYRAQSQALPTTTTISKVMVIVCLYDSTADKYDVTFTEEV